MWGERLVAWIQYMQRYMEHVLDKNRVSIWRRWYVVWTDPALELLGYTQFMGIIHIDLHCSQAPKDFVIPLHFTYQYLWPLNNTPLVQLVWLTWSCSQIYYCKNPQPLRNGIITCCLVVSGVPAVAELGIVQFLKVLAFIRWPMGMRVTGPWEVAQHPTFPLLSTLQLVMG